MSPICIELLHKMLLLPSGQSTDHAWNSFHIEEHAGVKLPSEETQHAGLLKIAGEGINEEESVKVTSIDDDAEEYMGKTLLAK